MLYTKQLARHLLGLTAMTILEPTIIDDNYEKINMVMMVTVVVMFITMENYKKITSMRMTGLILMMHSCICYFNISRE